MDNNKPDLSLFNTTADFSIDTLNLYLEKEKTYFPFARLQQTHEGKEPRRSSKRIKQLSTNFRKSKSSVEDDESDEEFEAFDNFPQPQPSPSPPLTTTAKWPTFTTYKNHPNHPKPDIGYLSTQTNLTAGMRAILIDWLLEVTAEYKLLRDTLYHCISLIDRCLSIMNVIETENLQLVGVTCLFLSCKFNENFYSRPTIEDFVNVTKKCYEKKEIVVMEKEILHILGYNVWGLGSGSSSSDSGSGGFDFNGVNSGRDGGDFDHETTTIDGNDDDEDGDIFHYGIDDVGNMFEINTKTKARRLYKSAYEEEERAYDACAYVQNLRNNDNGIGIGIAGSINKNDVKTARKNACKRGDCGNLNCRGRGAKVYGGEKRCFCYLVSVVDACAESWRRSVEVVKSESESEMGDEVEVKVLKNGLKKSKAAVLPVKSVGNKKVKKSITTPTIKATTRSTRSSSSSSSSSSSNTITPLTSPQPLQTLPPSTQLKQAYCTHLSPANSFQFMYPFLLAANAKSGEGEERLAYYLLELSLLEYGFIGYRPSLIAASTIYLSLATLKASTNSTPPTSTSSSSTWTSTLQHYTTYTKEELQSCVILLWQCHRQCNCSDGSGISDERKGFYKQRLERYKKDEFGKVGEIEVCEFETLGF